MMSFYKLIRLAVVMGMLAVSHHASALQIADHPVLQSLVETMFREDGYPRTELIRVLESARIDQKTLELMNRQYESLPWYQYRKHFINKRRINDGVKFWNAHQATLDKATDQFGIPQSIIVALLGVETHYGVRMGSRRVLDSLATLSAEFPRRSKFFTSELRIFLNTARKENIDPSTVVGSFAGAIGIPQFMPSSYQAYAIDFNDNGQRDLVNEFEDAIGSVANYLKRHGWQRHQTIYADISQELSPEAVNLVSKKVKPGLTHQQLHAVGITYDSEKASEKVALLRLKEKNHNRYIVGYKNLYVLTRYNPSLNYAMAIIELADSVKHARSG